MEASNSVLLFQLVTERMSSCVTNLSSDAFANSHLMP